MLLTIFATLWAVSYAGAGNPADLTAANRGVLDPRSSIVPYASERASIDGLTAQSDYLIPLTEWQMTRKGNAQIYTSRFKRPFAWNDRGVILRIDGAAGAFSVAVNATEVAFCPDAACRREIDISKESIENYNTLTVTVYASTATDRLNSGDAFVAEEGFRAAYIITQPAVRIRDVVVEARHESSRGYLSVGVAMNSRLLNSKEYNIYYRLLDPAGSEVAQGKYLLRTERLSEDTVRFNAIVEGVKPWNHESPNLYTLLLRTQFEGRYKEYVAVRVGFRNVELEDTRIAVDGVQVPMSVAPFEWQGNVESSVAAMTKLKADGVRCLKISCTQPDDLFLAADRVGMYVCAVANIDASGSGNSLQKGGTLSNDPQWMPVYERRIDELYHWTKVHPSVVAFALAAAPSANGYCMQEGYLRLKSMQKQRPVVYPFVGEEWNSDNVAELMGDGSGAMPVPVRQPVAIDARSLWHNGQIEVSNANLLAPVEVTVEYRILSGKKVIRKGSQSGVIGAANVERFTLPVEGLELTNKSSADITVRYENPVYEYFPAQSSVTASLRRGVQKPEQNDRQTVIEQHVAR